ncbi:MAG: hypothetical protein LBK82_08085 [Planctomycetaceae bacterium]|jgi:hypothetical protein|nr:hypothetical protein [Planctomycetaceae bacterium]
MNRLFFVLVFCCGFSGVIGCSDSNPKKPEGFPTLYPVTLILTQEGKPLAETTVTLIAKNKSKWGSSGFSNTDGKVELKTNGFIGVPAGQFNIVVTKTISEGMPTTPDETGNPKTYTLIEKIYTDPNTSPLTLEVTSETKDVTLETGKAVKIRID